MGLVRLESVPDGGQLRAAAPEGGPRRLLGRGGKLARPVARGGPGRAVSRHRRRYPGTAHLISYCVLIEWFISSHFTHKFFNLFLTILWYKFKWTGLWGELTLEKTFKLARSVARGGPTGGSASSPASLLRCMIWWTGLAP